MKAQNLNELRYIIILAHKSLIEEDTYYFVDEWPNPELAEKAVDENSTIQIFESVYFSTVITDAKTYTDSRDARRRTTSMRDFAPMWSTSLKPVSARVFFKARLMGA